MDALWCDLRHPEPLVRILPERTRGGQAGLTVVKAPTKDEWRRFEQYALRVRILRYSTALGDGDRGISAPFINWESIARYYRGRHLLPNLHTFVSKFEYVHEWFHLFVGPPLRHIELMYYYWLPTGGLIRALCTCPQTLKTAKFRIPKSTKDPKTMEQFVTAILSMEALTTLEVDAFLARPVEQLQRLGSLQQLSLSIPAYGPDSSARLRLPALEQLRMEAPDTADASPVASFIRCLDVPSLRALTIRSPNQRAAQLAPEYMRSIASAAAPFAELRSFALEGCLNGVLSIDDLSPLFACRRLESMNLFYTAVTLQPSDIDTVARAWPDLKLLRLGEENYGSQSTLKIYDLLPFALHCPRLELLGLPVLITDADVSPESTTSSRGTSPRATSQLKTLRLRKNDVKCASADVAAFLASVFPHAVLKPASANFDRTIDAITAMKDALLDGMSERPAAAPGSVWYVAFSVGSSRGLQADCGSDRP
ncbi:hypothetical protein PsYK624_011470 [Phanerochaete sordida]|uniref:F-box domain-containing protein n=1 Tax=Phanerochaete sordida TaxID=48140 RepID=A0A9P3FZ99_9APHY|nr:hypothetical protein PsYK624_011470 [Phanerochaete sordida]